VFGSTSIDKGESYDVMIFAIANHNRVVNGKRRRTGSEAAWDGGEQTESHSTIALDLQPLILRQVTLHSAQ
jgi:hypothetical protein